MKQVARVVRKGPKAKKTKALVTRKFPKIRGTLTVTWGYRGYIGFRV